MSDDYKPSFDLIMGRMRLTDAGLGTVLENTKTGERFVMPTFRDMGLVRDLLNFIMEV